jgi:Peptidase family M1 domain
MKADSVPDWNVLGPLPCYILTLDLDPDNLNYTGTAMVSLTNNSDAPIPDLVFRTYPNSDVIYGGSLTIDSAAVNENPAAGEAFLDDMTAYRIPLNNPLPPGESLEVDLSFSGQIPQDYAGLPDVYGIFNYDPANQFISLANWYPILAQRRDGDWIAELVVGTGDAVVSETALYLVEVTAPDDWKVVTTGSEVGQVEGTRNGSLYASGPVRDFMVLASPNISEEQLEVEGTTIRHWGLPDGKGRWQEALQDAQDSLTVYNEDFGAYPYAELDVIAAPMKNALGVEYPGVFLVGESLYQPDPARPYLMGIVVAHEAAHQWWYGVVGNDVLEDPWQDEGLTSFSSTLFLEAYQPSYYEGTLQAYRDTVSEIEDQYPSDELAVSRSVSSFQNNETIYSPVVYQKGALFFQALREKLGDEVFLSALKAYFSANRYRLASPEDLLDSFEAACGCDLQGLYQDWGVN